MTVLDTLALALRVLDLGATIALVGIGVFATARRSIILLLFAVAIVLPLLRLVVQAAVIGDGDVFGTLGPLISATRYGQAMLARAVIVALWWLAYTLLENRGSQIHAPLPLVGEGGQRPGEGVQPAMQKNTLIRASRTFSRRREKGKLKRYSLIVAMVFAGLDIVALALLGHGAASTMPAIGIVVLALHIGAACLWLGGMAVVLTGVVRHASVAALRGFAPLGLACVAVLTITGLLNLQIVTGDVLGAFSGGYGRILIAKLICFAAMLGLAAVNRFALLPQMTAPDGRASHRATLALAGETLLGGVVIVLASLLASGPPA